MQRLGWIPIALLPGPPIYHEVNPADVPVLILALTSDTLPLHEVNDYAATTLVQKLSQISGVGAVTVEGGQTRAVRLQADVGEAGRPWTFAGGRAPRDRRQHRGQSERPARRRAPGVPDRRQRPVADRGNL